MNKDQEIEMLKAQLAEAVGLLRFDYNQDERQPTDDALHEQKVRAFLARHAQSEQQEPTAKAQYSDVISDGGMDPRDRPLQEAQGAVVGGETPIPEYFQEACDKFDWTPEEALRFYAEGKHFDTDRGRTRVLDTGAIASNALKHASLAYLEMKGDAELSELRAALTTQPAAGDPIHQWADQDLWMDGDEADMARAQAEHGADAAAHGDEKS